MIHTLYCRGNRFSQINNPQLHQVFLSLQVFASKWQCHKIFWGIFFISLIQPIWATDKQVKMVPLKNSFSTPESLSLYSMQIVESLFVKPKGTVSIVLWFCFKAECQSRIVITKMEKISEILGREYGWLLVLDKFFNLKMCVNFLIHLYLPRNKIQQ